MTFFEPFRHVMRQPEMAQGIMHRPRLWKGYTAGLSREGPLLPRHKGHLSFLMPLTASSTRDSLTERTTGHPWGPTTLECRYCNYRKIFVISTFYASEKAVASLTPDTADTSARTSVAFCGSESTPIAIMASPLSATATVM